MLVVNIKLQAESPHMRSIVRGGVQKL